ncbi:MAG TPA: rhomboid family intramembrane serine protease [Rudaea sp.]|jgi:membrane associated rhomboid family serine protease|nr:rhomboid family intramembrane serine protease [Rudaea sp.]
MPRIPPITAALLVANILLFLVQQAQPDFMLAHFALWPIGHYEQAQLSDGTPISVGFEIWQVVTYAFLHGSFGHIAFNMIALWSIGGQVELALGTQRFIIYYFACVLGAAAAQLATVALMTPTEFYPTLGASGGVFGVLLAFAYLFPQAKIMVMVPIPIPARIAAIGYLAIEFFLGVTGRQAGVAHFAHLGGALVGLLLLVFWRSRQRRF